MCPTVRKIKKGRREKKKKTWNRNRILAYEAGFLQYLYSRVVWFNAAIIHSLYKSGFGYNKVKREKYKKSLNKERNQKNK